MGNSGKLAGGKKHGQLKFPCFPCFLAKYSDQQGNKKKKQQKIDEPCFHKHGPSNVIHTGIKGVLADNFTPRADNLYIYSQFMI